MNNQILFGFTKSNWLTNKEQMQKNPNTPPPPNYFKFCPLCWESQIKAVRLWTVHQDTDACGFFIQTYVFQDYISAPL